MPGAESRFADAGSTVGPMEAVALRRSPRDRRWRLEAPWGEPARLTVPRWMSSTEVERVLGEKRAWIEAERQRQLPRLGLDWLTVALRASGKAGQGRSVAPLPESA